MVPVTIDIRDFAQAIQDGEVDAQENPLANMRQFGLQRFRPFVTMTGHFHGIALLLCNANSWARWPDDIRQALCAAASESTAAQWSFASDDETAARAEFEAQGVCFVDWTTLHAQRSSGRFVT